MQPYFFPYAGYYRLLAAAETFIVFDDAQFPRSGRVHRCELPGPTGKTEWLTLPLKRHPLRVAIKDLDFAENARIALDRRLARLSWIDRARGPLSDRVRELLMAPLMSPTSFIVESIRLVADALELPARIIIGSGLAVAPQANRTQRLIAAVEAVGGHTYVNSPGGRSLYESTTFLDNGINLRFLNPYGGNYPFMLQAMVQQNANALRKDILRDCELVP